MWTRLRGWHMTAGAALFALLLGWYILTMSGHTYSSDEETMLAAGESLVSTGWFDISRDETFLMNRVRGVDGRSYSRYGPGQSVVAAPFIAAGRALAGTAPGYTVLIIRIGALLLPALITAATGLLLYAWAREIGYGARPSLLVGLLFGLTSLAWPYSRTFFAEPLATFFLVLSAYGLRRGERHWWAIAGAAAAAALATKLQTGLALPLIAGYGLLCSWGRRPESRGEQWWAAGVWRPVVGRAAFGLLGAALPLAVLLLYNTLVFGGPLDSGYGGVSAERFLSGNWRRGLYGLTLSTGKGLLLFSPTIVLGLAGMFFGVRRQWRESLLAAAMLAAHLAFYSQVEYWHGDGSWGPRYMLFVVPFLYLPAAGLLAWIAELPADGLPLRWMQVAGRWGIAALAIAGFLVQLLPVLLNFNVYLQVSTPRERYFTPAASPIVWHARIWLSRADEWWSKLVGGPPGTATLRSDFSYSEGDRAKGELLPRWSYGEAQIRLDPAAAGAIDGRMVVADHRPWPLPRADFALLLDGQPLEGVRRVDLDGNQIRWELTFALPPDRARRGALLTLRTTTWNPSRDVKDNPRNENLGLLVETLELRQGDQPLTLRESLPIPAPELSRRGLWLWTQDSPNHHLFDTWLWYLAVSRMPAGAAALLLAAVALPALLLLLLGTSGVLAAFRAPPVAATPATSARMGRGEFSRGGKAVP